MMTVDLQTAEWPGNERWFATACRGVDYNANWLTTRKILTTSTQLHLLLLHFRYFPPR